MTPPRISLDALDPDAGNHATEPDVKCSLLCHLAEADFGEPTHDDR